MKEVITFMFSVGESGGGGSLPMSREAPGLQRAATLSKQETPEIYFYLVLSLLSLVSVENESGFHKTPS